MKFSLREKIALIIHFNDSIGEGYGYYDSNFVLAKTSGRICIPDFKKLKKIGVSFDNDYSRSDITYKVSKKYLDVADAIIGLLNK